MIAASRDARFDAEPVQQVAQGLAIEGFIGHEGGGLLLRTSWFAADRGDVHDQGQ